MFENNIPLAMKRGCSHPDAVGKVAIVPPICIRSKILPETNYVVDKVVH